MEIQKIYSDLEGEEMLYSVLMTEEEVALFSELKEQDQEDLETIKSVSTKGDRKALIKIYEGGGNINHKLAMRDAKFAGGGGAIAGGIIGGTLGYIAKGSKKGAALGAGLGAVGGGTLLGGSSYVGSRAGISIGNKIRKRNGIVERTPKEQADLIRVANGDMSKKEYIKKHYKK